MTASEIWSALGRHRQLEAKRHPGAYKRFCWEMENHQFGIEPTQDAWDWFVIGWNATRSPIHA